MTATFVSRMKLSPIIFFSFLLMQFQLRALVVCIWFLSRKRWAHFLFEFHWLQRRARGNDGQSPSENEIGGKSEKRHEFISRKLLVVDKNVHEGYSFIYIDFTSSFFGRRNWRAKARYGIDLHSKKYTSDEFERDLVSKYVTFYFVMFYLYPQSWLNDTSYVEVLRHN